MEDVTEDMLDTMVYNADLWKKPNTKIIRLYAYAFDLNYRKSEKEIFEEFDKVSNDEVINRRIHLINASYHTRVPVEEMVKNIRNSTDIDSLISKGDQRAVDCIANCGGKQYLVFATKYCCFGNPKKFPIYDRLCLRTLKWFYKDDDLYKLKVDCLLNLKRSCDYEAYRKCIDAFIERYALKVEDYKELDKYLWLVGKNITA